MRKAICYLLFLCCLGCSATETTLVEPSSTIEPSTSTTTTVLAVEAQVEVSESGQACLPIGDPYTDATIHNLIWDGYDLDYVKGTWYFEGTEIGWAAFEDEAFQACGPTETIALIERYQAEARENS